MFTLFVEGGAGFMSLLTINLILILIAAWKAPNWIQELGAMAIVLGVFGVLLGLRQAFMALQLAPDISPALVYGGMKVLLIPILYSLIIYFISLVLRIVRKPRI